MLLSVLIAAYQAGPYLPKALASLRAQTHADWELIVVEDGSRDETEALVHAFAASVSQSVRYENLGVNQGVATARTKLLSLATGPAATFLDADDWWTPTHLASLDAAFAAGADLVATPIQIYDLTHDRPLEIYTPPAALTSAPVATLFATSAIMTSTCVALRTALAKQVGPFDPSFRIGEDRDYWLRCALAGARFSTTTEPTAFYAKHATSTMGKTLLWAQQEAAFYEKHFQLAAIPAAERRARLAHALSNHARLLRATDPAASAQQLFRAWKLCPFRLVTLAHALRSKFARSASGT